MGAESRGKRDALYANNFFAIKKIELHSKQSMYSTNYFPFGKKHILRISWYLENKFNMIWYLENK